MRPSNKRVEVEDFFVSDLKFLPSIVQSACSIRLGCVQKSINAINENMSRAKSTLSSSNAKCRLLNFADLMKGLQAKCKDQEEKRKKTEEEVEELKLENKRMEIELIEMDKVMSEKQKEQDIERDRKNKLLQSIDQKKGASMQITFDLCILSKKLSSFLPHVESAVDEEQKLKKKMIDIRKDVEALVVNINNERKGIINYHILISAKNAWKYHLRNKEFTMPDIDGAIDAVRELNEYIKEIETSNIQLQFSLDKLSNEITGKKSDNSLINSDIEAEIIKRADINVYLNSNLKSIQSIEERIVDANEAITKAELELFITNDRRERFPAKVEEKPPNPSAPKRTRFIKTNW